MIKSLIDITDLSERELEELIETACDIIANPDSYREKCRGKKLATLFFEPSTRTRLSFEAAMYELGGNVLAFPSEQNAEFVESFIGVKHYLIVVVSTKWTANEMITPSRMDPHALPSFQQTHNHIGGTGCTATCIIPWLPIISVCDEGTTTTIVPGPMRMTGRIVGGSFIRHGNCTAMDSGKSAGSMSQPTISHYHLGEESP